MLVFFIIVLLLVVITVITVISSTIHIEVSKLHITNITPKAKLKKEFQIKLQLYFLNQIKIFQIGIDEKKLRKWNFPQKINPQIIDKMKKEVPDKERAKKLLKKLQIDLSNFECHIVVGTIDVILTAAIVGILSSVLGILLSRVVEIKQNRKYSYQVTPLYIDKNRIKIDLNCIIQVKMVHIIYVIWSLLKKRRVNKNERTSNRRSYDYGYE